MKANPIDYKVPFRIKIPLSFFS